MKWLQMMMKINWILKWDRVEEEENYENNDAIRTENKVSSKNQRNMKWL